jgi:hypothetical protein
MLSFSRPRLEKQPPSSGLPPVPVPLGPAGVPADNVYHQLLQRSYALRLRCAVTRHQAMAQRNVSVQLRGATEQLRMCCMRLYAPAWSDWRAPATDAGAALATVSTLTDPFPLRTSIPHVV